MHIWFNTYYQYVSIYLFFIFIISIFFILYMIYKKIIIIYNNMQY